MHQVFSGPVAGDALLLLDPAAAAILTELLTDVPPLPLDLDPSSREVFTEVGNILLNACIGTLRQHAEGADVVFGAGRRRRQLPRIIERFAPNGDAFRYALVVTAGFRLRDRRSQDTSSSS